MTAPRINNHRLRTSARRALLLVLALLSPGWMWAQFSGPAIVTKPEANQAILTTTDPAILNPGLQDVTISAGDVLTIRIFGSLEYAPPVRVSVDGSVQLPLIGVVPIAGLTVNQAEDRIASRLKSAGMYNNPQVSVQITETPGQFATVSGEMHAVVPVVGDRRLFEVLAAAGSLPPTASHIVTILRPGVEKPIVIDLGTDPARSAQANILIRPRDTILISRVGVVWMVGAFKAQGAIPLQQNSPLTLIEATALSGGANFEGKFEDLRIVRTTGLTRNFVKIDIKRVLQGKDPDPVLQADDIVFLPTSGVKAAIKGNGIGAITSIASLLIIALQNR